MVCLLASASAFALQPPAEVRDAILAGRPDTLAARYPEPRTPEQWHWLAQAYANQAERAAHPERNHALDRAESCYRQWVEGLKNAGSDTEQQIKLAAAHVELGRFLMRLRAGPELDRLEITNGRQGDRRQLKTWLTAARDGFQAAEQILAPLYTSLAEHEDEWLAAGIYDELLQTRLAAKYQLAWAEYYLGWTLESRHPQRAGHLRSAENRFRELLGNASAEHAVPCALGLGLTLRALNRLEDAEALLADVLKQATDPPLEAQVRYELARCQLARQKFDAARRTLAPLLETESAGSEASDNPARLYINLARLWDAYSHVLEAEALAAQATEGTARQAILRRARACRESGLRKLDRLARRGEPWPAVVQLYVTSDIDPGQELTALHPIELFYSAQASTQAGRREDARQRLEAAAGLLEKGVESGRLAPDDADLAARVLMSLGECYYRMGQTRRAAETFARLARRYRGHDLAPQAATHAFRLWGQVAQASGDPEDAWHLAETLRNLLEAFPDHPQRPEAAWLYPVALQAAGRYEEAARAFAMLPPDGPHGLEAGLRRGICRRLALEAEREALPPTEYARRAHELALEFSRWAEGASQQALEGGETPDNELAIEARLQAAELLCSPGVEDYAAALALLENVIPAKDDLVRRGRLLAVRIRAWCGLRWFTEAAAVVGDFLQAVPQEEAGPVLLTLARGMQAEVERLRQAGETEAAGRLAGESLQTFSLLETRLRGDPQRTDLADAVAFARARMLYLAGRLAEADELTARLCTVHPKNGPYLRLRALVLTARSEATPSPAMLAAARTAWAELLKDAGLRQRSPERYWEARYHWLALLLREGRAAEVEKAIGQDLVWFPELGGPPWRENLLALREKARKQLGTASSPAEAGKPAPPAGHP